MSPEALTPQTAPIIDDFVVDPTLAERRMWERAVKACLDAARQEAADTSGRGQAVFGCTALDCALTEGHAGPHVPEAADTSGLRALAAAWEREARRRLADKSRDSDPANLLAAGINRSHAQELRAALAAGATERPLDECCTAAGPEGCVHGWVTEVANPVGRAATERVDAEPVGLRERLWALHEQQHDSFDDGEWCASCHVEWPCPTGVLLSRAARAEDDGLDSVRQAEADMARAVDRASECAAIGRERLTMSEANGQVAADTSGQLREVAQMLHDDVCQEDDCEGWDRVSSFGKRGWGELAQRVIARVNGKTDPEWRSAQFAARDALTPLQREVATEPTCSRCQRDITRLDDLYRCAQCKAAFHLPCIYEHFGWSVNGPNDTARADHAAALAAGATERPLDVERLTRALNAVGWNHRGARQEAEIIAAEYARLSPATPEAEEPFRVRIRSANCAAGDHDDCLGMVEQDRSDLGITDCLCQCHAATPEAGDA